MTTKEEALEIIRRFDRANTKNLTDFATEFHVFFREATMSKEDEAYFSKLADICSHYSPYKEDRLKWKGFTDETQLLDAVKIIIESE